MIELSRVDDIFQENKLKNIIPIEDYIGYQQSFLTLIHNEQHLKVIHHTINNLFPYYDIDVNLNSNRKLFESSPHVSLLMQKLKNDLGDVVLDNYIPSIALFYHRHRSKNFNRLNDFTNFDYFAYCCLRNITTENFLSLISYCNAHHIIISITSWNNYLTNHSEMPLEWFLSLEKL